MEANAQYALHDSEETSPAWAARVRLTPELLEKLRHAPEKVLLRLNVAVTESTSKARSSSKKTSLLTVKMAADGEVEETEEQYELLSFPEDPAINHVCTFRREAVGDAEGGGYSIYKTGAIHQKLLVQRLLDDTEKDRIKDKHAKSVLESKSRSSMLIDPRMEKPAKRQRLMTRLSSMSTPRMSAGGSAWATAAGHKRASKLVLPSALTKEGAKQTKEWIEKGFEVKETPTNLTADGNTREYSDDDDEQKEVPKVIVSAATAAAARDADFHALFSSDSDNAAVGPRKKISRKGKKKASNSIDGSPRNTGKHEATFTKDKEVTRTEVDTTAQLKSAEATNPADGDTSGGDLVAQSKPMGETRDIYALKPIKPSASGVEVKRARVRSALVSDRVKQSRLPDLSFFPSVVVLICHRLANYRGRSVILDESDYNSFVETHEQFRQDWEMLDKAYSIELIKTEGLHLQLEVNSADTHREQLEARVQASSSKKEGLLFIRDAMMSIQKILHSLEISVDRFNMKPH